MPVEYRKRADRNNWTGFHAAHISPLSSEDYWVQNGFSRWIMSKGERDTGLTHARMASLWSPLCMSYLMDFISHDRSARDDLLRSKMVLNSRISMGILEFGSIDLSKIRNNSIFSLSHTHTHTHTSSYYEDTCFHGHPLRIDNR
ncbi:hypothetical protein V1527DRAFT_134346 [Lipomyces starkeyi]